MSQATNSITVDAEGRIMVTYLDADGVRQKLDLTAQIERIADAMAEARVKAHRQEWHYGAD